MSKIKLAHIDTRAPKKFSKEQCKRELKKLKIKFERLQNLLYAESKHSLLVILQGLDASGKDGAIRNVFEAANPLGCRVIAFKEPTELELKHDFLWRIHQHVPEKGLMNVFNRSHYEVVVAQRVHEWVNEKTIQQRFEHINDFEKLLGKTGTTILKFYLHVSKKEQMKRLKERLNDKTKMWKHNANDIKERSYWNQYLRAYEDVFDYCSDYAEWTIVPSDDGWYKEWVIAKKIVEALESFHMRFPGIKKTKGSV